MNLVNVRTNKIQPLDRSAHSEHLHQHSDVSFGAPDPVSRPHSPRTSTQFSEGQRANNNHSEVTVSVNKHAALNRDIQNAPSNERSAGDTGSKTGLLVKTNCSSKDLNEHGVCLCPPRFQGEVILGSADDIRVKARYIVRSILAVCFVSSLTILCLLVYDIVDDGIKANVHTIKDGCIKETFAAVDLYYNVLTFYESSMFKTSCTSGSPGVVDLGDSEKSAQELADLCQTVSRGVFLSSCVYLVRNASTTADVATLSASLTHILELTNHVRDVVVTCVGETGDLPWMLYSVYLGLVELLRDVSQEAVFCCLKSFASPAYGLECSLKHRAVLSHIDSLLEFPLAEKNFQLLGSSTWNATETLNGYDEISRCTNETDLSSAQRQTLATMRYVHAALDDLEVLAVGQNADKLNHQSRRVVFGCLAILTGIGTGILLYFQVKKMAGWIVRHARSLEKKTEELDAEKANTERLLYQMLPPTIANQLRSGLQVMAENYDSVSIYFSDIVSFTSIAAQSTPLQVVELLNSLYSIFDSRIDTYDVYKVETIGDAYMVASGVPSRNGDKHAEEIATMSIDLLAAVKQVHLPAHIEDRHLKIRIGIHSGTCVAGVVGLKMPRYCLFGDTVNTASRMESNSEPMRIHMSKDTKELLDKTSNYLITPRGQVNIKGKGVMETFWLEGRKDMGECNDSMVCMWRPKKRCLVAKAENRLGGVSETVSSNKYVPQTGDGLEILKHLPAFSGTDTSFQNIVTEVDKIPETSPMMLNGTKNNHHEVVSVNQDAVADQVYSSTPQIG